MTDEKTMIDPPNTPEPEPKPLREQVKDAVDARDAETLVALLDPLLPSAALRQLLLLAADDRETAAMNRPGFPRGLFVQNSGGFFKSIHLCMEFVLQFLRRPMAIGAV